MMLHHGVVKDKIRVAIIGASGYTGADLVRLLYRHPHVHIVALATRTYAGKKMQEVFGHFYGAELPLLIPIEQIDYQNVDVVFSALPHGLSHGFIKKIPKNVRIIDLSADFRLLDINAYEHWYQTQHEAKDLMEDAVYGLSEHFENHIKDARIIACPGCYPTAALLSLLPLVRENLICLDDIIIDAKSGVSGAGRSLKHNTLFCEAAEGVKPYSVGKHRHMVEIEEKLSLNHECDVSVSFTPHLVPMSRGELVTSYVRLHEKACVEDLRKLLQKVYEKDIFVRVYNKGDVVNTQNVKGSNYCDIAVFADNIKHRAIVIAAIDNLVKGSSGQAVQNFNIMYNFSHDCGLQQLSLFP